jgi:hypothetical protein
MVCSKVSYRHKDWTALVGIEVEIKQLGESIRCGTVDDAMPDSPVIWLAADHRAA